MKDIEYQHVLFNYPLPLDIKHSATLEPVLRYMYNRTFLQAGTAVDESHCNNNNNDRLTAFDPGQPG